jgi:hypothetical protein
MAHRLSLGATLCVVLVACVTAAPANGDGLPLPIDGSNEASVGSLDGAYSYSAVTNGSQTTVLRIAADGGEIERARTIPGEFSVPLVAYDGSASGVSADGRTLILIEPRTRFPRETTEFQVVSTSSLKPRHLVRLNGDFSFDAVSPDGRTIYLVHYQSRRDPTDYEVRAYDVAAGKLVRAPIVDPDEPDEQMAGFPQTRATSPDGRWAYTLYGGGHETFIHALDTAGHTAQCIDLEGFGPRDLWRLDLRVDQATGELTVLERGEPAATVDPVTFAVSEVVPEAAAGPEASADDAGGSDWLGTAAIAAGVALFAAALTLLVRRNRRATA